MPDNQDIEDKFWKALQSDMTLMLGVAGSHILTGFLNANGEAMGRQVGVALDKRAPC